MEALFFYAFAALALLSALGLWIARDAVIGVLCFLAVQLALAGIFVLLEAHLLAALVAAVYCGSLVALFLFGILLLGSDPGFERRRVASFGKVVLGGMAAAGLLALWGERLGWTLGGSQQYPEAVPDGFGGFAALGAVLYDAYLVPVELAGVLLLTALVGGLILARWGLD